MRGNVSLPIEVFCCYARSDLAFCEELKKHLAGLVRSGLIRIWFDSDIGPGTAWEQEISIHLHRSRIILLLISADFLASDYCYGREMKRALERHHAKEARVVPILLRSVDWVGTPFSALQMLPSNALAVTSWPNRNEAFVDVVKGIRRVVKDLHPKDLAVLDPPVSVTPELPPESLGEKAPPVNASPQQTTPPPTATDVPALPPMKARFYHPDDIDIEGLASDLVETCILWGYQAQQIGSQDRMIVQVKKGGRVKALIGMQVALSLTLQKVSRGVLVMVGEQKWVDKAAVGMAGIIIMSTTPLWVLLPFTAGTGAVQQAELGSRILKLTDDLVRQQKPSIQVGPVPSHLRQQYVSMPLQPSGTSVLGHLCCPNCNDPYEMGDMFCSSCGHSLLPVKQGYDNDS